MWRSLVFVVAVTIWNPAVEAVPQGDNTCQGVVKHPVKVKVNVTEPVTFRTYTWCLRVPPRCSKYVTQMRERVKEQIEMHNRTITVCCRGYVEMESKCVPACPPMTECPNMHCNRTNHCYCSPGYSGVFCNDPCPKGAWGKDCKKPCDCPDGFTCHHLTGDCMLDDKPSVKTTVRRAFTHISSELIPTTLRTVMTSTEQTTPPTHSTTVLKTTFMPTSPPARAMTQIPDTNMIEKYFIPTNLPPNVDNFNPTSGQTSFPSVTKPSTSATTTTTLTTTITTPTTPATTITTSTTTTTPTTTITTPTTTSLATTIATSTTTTTSTPSTTNTPTTTPTTTTTPSTIITTPTTTTTPTTPPTTPTTTNTITTTPTPSTIITTPTTPPKITILPNIIGPTDSVTSPKMTTSVKNFNFEIPTISPFLSLSPQQSSNIPPVDTFVISNDDSFAAHSTEATTSLKTLHLPEIATVPLYVVNQELNPQVPSDVPMYFDQKTLTPDNTDYLISDSDEKSITSLLSTLSNINEATTSGLIIINDTARTFQTVANTVTPLISTSYQSKSILEPTLKFDSILLQPSNSNNFAHEETTTYSTPDLTTYFIEASPKLIELLSTKKDLDEKEQPIVFSTASTSAHFNNPPFTNPVDSPMAPMQTPNRNWNPFIPSPGSTKSHGRLTIPFSDNIPVTELTSNVKTDTPTDFFAETLGLETIRVGANPSIKGTSDQVNPIRANSFTKSSLANTFLHSFVQPSDASMSSHEENLYSTYLPDTVNFFNSVTLKKPYFIDRSFDHNQNTHSKEKSIDISTSITPSLISSVGTLKKKESKNSQEKYVKEFSTTNLYKEFMTEHTDLRASPSVIDYYANYDKERTTVRPTDTHLTSQTPFIIAVANKPAEEIEKDDQIAAKMTKNSFILFTPEEVQQHTTKGLFSNMEKSLDFTGVRKDESLKPALFYPNKLNPRIISAEKGVSVEPSMEESVNILSKNEFISLIRPKSVIRVFSEISTPLVEQETKSGINEISTVSSIAPSTYSVFDKTVTASEILYANSQRVLDNVVTNRDEFKNTKVPFTTPLSPKEIHSIVNGRILEEPSNYLPTNNEKSTTTPIYQDLELRDKTVKLSEEFSVTQQPHSGYIPTNKDFLNLTYILNTINDFTSNTKRGMMQSKSSIYGNPKVKFTENPTLNELVTNAVYDTEPSTEVMRPISVYPTRKYWKQDSNHGSRQQKEKNSGNDSKIIHLNISSHLSFHNPTTKYSSQEYKNLDPSNQRGIGITTPIDGRITTVSILSTVPELKYQVKRSTKEYLQKTENAFTLNLPLEELVTSPNSGSIGEISHVTTDSSSTVSPEDLRIVPTVSMQPAPESEEVSKKPFRRKGTRAPYDELEDVGPNMTAALAAHSSRKDSSINLTTGLLATVTCVLLLGSLITGIVITFIYCKKEKPVPMESCIMAYEQMNTSDPAAIYSVPRPSLSPEIFFCPTFTHHYAAQINKELRELSYSPTKKENFEPLYTEISTDVTSV